ncbi:MAG: signal peptidase I [Candidatus Falkowbacteria bacterium]|nr:signal peptidase I [Candidatus Falkowbacteria bacterium]
MKKFLSFVFDVVKMIVISLAIIIPIRYFLVQPFYVKGASMEPNFHENEYLMVDEISYRFKTPQRGDVIVFRYPKDPQEYYIKRLIGLPGETVEIKDGSVYITEENGLISKVEEPYLPAYVTTVALTEGAVKLGPDEYYMMGDNRNGSKDSRSFGPVKKSFVIGRVFLRGWPVSDFGLINGGASGLSK